MLWAGSEAVVKNKSVIQSANTEVAPPWMSASIEAGGIDWWRRHYRERTQAQSGREKELWRKAREDPALCEFELDFGALGTTSGGAEAEAEAAPRGLTRKCDWSVKFASRDSQRYVRALYLISEEMKKLKVPVPGAAQDVQTVPGRSTRSSRGLGAKGRGRNRTRLDRSENNGNSGVSAEQERESRDSGKRLTARFFLHLHQEHILRSYDVPVLHGVRLRFAGTADNVILSPRHHLDFMFLRKTRDLVKKHDIEFREKVPQLFWRGSPTHMVRGYEYEGQTVAAWAHMAQNVGAHLTYTDFDQYRTGKHGVKKKVLDRMSARDRELFSGLPARNKFWEQAKKAAAAPGNGNDAALIAWGESLGWKDGLEHSANPRESEVDWRNGTGHEQETHVAENFPRDPNFVHSSQKTREFLETELNLWSPKSQGLCEEEHNRQIGHPMCVRKPRDREKVAPDRLSWPKVKLPLEMALTNPRIRLSAMSHEQRWKWSRGSATANAVKTRQQKHQKLVPSLADEASIWGRFPINAKMVANITNAFYEPETHWEQSIAKWDDDGDENANGTANGDTRHVARPAAYPQSAHQILPSAKTGSSHTPVEEQLRYKYWFSADGTGGASTMLIYAMWANVVLFRVDCCHDTHWDRLLVPFKHYIPVRPDLSDLREKLAFVEAHPKWAEKMVEWKKRDFAERMRPDVQMFYLYETLRRLAEAQAQVSGEVGLGSASENRNPAENRNAAANANNEIITRHVQVDDRFFGTLPLTLAADPAARKSQNSNSAKNAKDEHDPNFQWHGFYYPTPYSDDGKWFLSPEVSMSGIREHSPAEIAMPYGDTRLPYREVQIWAHRSDPPNSVSSDPQASVLIGKSTAWSFPLGPRHLWVGGSGNFRRVAYNFRRVDREAMEKPCVNAKNSSTVEDNSCHFSKIFGSRIVQFDDSGKENDSARRRNRGSKTAAASGAAKEIIELPLPIFALSKDGRKATGLNYARLCALTNEGIYGLPVPSNVGNWELWQARPKIAHDDGVFLMRWGDLSSSDSDSPTKKAKVETKLIVSAAEVVDYLYESGVTHLQNGREIFPASTTAARVRPGPRDRKSQLKNSWMEHCYVWLEQPMFSDDGERVSFFARGKCCPPRKLCNPEALHHTKYFDVGVFTISGRWEDYPEESDAGAGSAAKNQNALRKRLWYAGSAAPVSHFDFLDTRGNLMYCGNPGMLRIHDNGARAPLASGARAIVKPGAARGELFMTRDFHDTGLGGASDGGVQAHSAGGAYHDRMAGHCTFSRFENERYRPGDWILTDASCTACTVACPDRVEGSSATNSTATTCPRGYQTGRYLGLLNTNTATLYRIGLFAANISVPEPLFVDLHPRFSPDGGTVLIDSMHEHLEQSASKLYAVDVSTITGANSTIAN